MKQKSAIKQRILEYVDNKGISKYEFYKTTGITRGILDQPNGITETNILKFINTYPKVNISWLITGEDPMIRPEPSDNTISNFNDSKNLPHHSINALSSNIIIPLIPIEQLPAYFNHESIAQNIGFQTNFLETVFSDADFYTIVRDLSLFPSYNSGDVIACKIIQPTDFIQWNKFYLLSTHQGTIVKRILQGKDDDHLTMSSDNPSFHAFEISRDQIIAMAIVKGGVHLE